MFNKAILSICIQESWYYVEEDQGSWYYVEEDQE